MPLQLKKRTLGLMEACKNKFNFRECYLNQNRHFAIVCWHYIPKDLAFSSVNLSILLSAISFFLLVYGLCFFCFVFEDMILFLSKSDSMTNVPRQFFKLPQQFRDNPEPNQIGRDQI